MLYDKDIREPLFSFLEDEYGKIRIIEEKQIGKSRADAVMVMEKALCGIEIKSDADTYVRLNGQIKNYDKFYDYNYIAVGTKHAMHIGEHVPEWWGIITIDETDSEPDFYILRKPKPNPEFNIKNKLGLMWRPELVSIQAKNKMPKYKEKSKKFVVGKIIDTVPEEKLNLQISEELFERDYTTIAKEIDSYRQKR